MPEYVSAKIFTYVLQVVTSLVSTIVLSHTYESAHSIIHRHTAYIRNELLMCVDKVPVVRKQSCRIQREMFSAHTLGTHGLLHAYG